jgi:hypothetical protein
MFFAGALWRLPVYAQDVGARNVGGAGLSLAATLAGLVIFGLSSVGLCKRQRWAAIVTAVALALTGAFIVVNIDGDPHYAAGMFGAVLAFVGVAGLLPFCWRAGWALRR